MCIRDRLIAVFLIFFSREIVLLVANDRYLAALAIVPPIILGKAFGPLYTDVYKRQINTLAKEAHICTTTYGKIKKGWM